MSITLPIKLLTPSAIMPTRGTPFAIGLDLYADVAAAGRDSYRVHAGMRLVIPCGIAVAVPHGFYGRVAPRSGLAVKSGIDVLAGVIDEDYRGEIMVILQNNGASQFYVKHGDRIAQLILERAAILPIQEVEELPETERGSAGFGSTGVGIAA